MNRQSMDWALALVATAMMAAILLFPAGAKPEDLTLEIAHVRTLPPDREGAPGHVEVLVRWHWGEGASASRSRHLIALGIDHQRWGIIQPSRGTGGLNEMLNLAGQPPVWSGREVEPGQSGEMTYILEPMNYGRYYDPPLIDLRVHYVTQGRTWSGWTQRSWVHTVTGSYSLK